MGTISTDRLKTYQHDELMFLCKSITWKTKNVHERIEELATEMEIDLRKSKLLQKPYRIDFTEKRYRKHEYIRKASSDKRTNSSVEKVGRRG